MSLLQDLLLDCLTEETPIFHFDKTSRRAHWDILTNNLFNDKFLSYYSELYSFSKCAISIWKGAEKNFRHSTKIFIYLSKIFIS